MKSRTNIKIRSLVICLMFFFICSCAVMPIKTYSGPDLPDTEIAIIKDSNPFNPFGMPVFINAIDGVRYKKLATKYAIVPGHHNVDVSCCGVRNSRKGWIHKRLFFEAKPGGTYKFRHTYDCSVILIMDSQ